MRVVIQENYDKMCKWAADYIAAKIKNHKEDRPFVLGLPTGSSPIGVYKELARQNQAGELSFANVVTFKLFEILMVIRCHSVSSTKIRNIWETSKYLTNFLLTDTDVQKFGTSEVPNFSDIYI